MATADMFGSTSEPASAKAPAAGFLVTNHLNLMYMLGAGMVMPPAGFGDKYYRDTLECFPGWVPLFVGKAPSEAIESTTIEAGHLKPAIVELDLSGLSGRVMAVADEGVRELDFPDRFTGTERVLLVPAPLPVSWIASITFRSADDKRACDADAKDFGNVPLEDFKPSSSRTRRISRRRRRSSSCSAVLSPSARRPSSRSACTTQLRIACADGSNSRAKSSGVRPARTSSIIWRRYSGA